MLSKLIYRFVAIAMFALFAQAGYSQNYVDIDVAQERLEEAISELQNDLSAGPIPTGQMQALGDQSGDKIRLQLMKTVNSEISTMKDVKDVMDSWYSKAEQQGPERKTKLILALDQVKELLT
ncbi:MAG: hypothetical protein V3V14_13580 [Saprospiraceae bacterium]